MYVPAQRGAVQLDFSMSSPIANARRIDAYRFPGVICPYCEQVNINREVCSNPECRQVIWRKPNKWPTYDFNRRMNQQNVLDQTADDADQTPLEKTGAPNAPNETTSLEEAEENIFAIAYFGAVSAAGTGA